MESPSRESLRDMFADIRRRLHALETADRLGSSSFREPGTIRYYDADGNVRLLFGTLVMPDGTELGLGLLVQRADGTDILQVWDGQASLHHADGTPGVAITDDLDQVQLQGIDGAAGIIVQAGQRDLRYADDETREAVVVTGGQTQIHDWDGNVVLLTGSSAAGIRLTDGDADDGSYLRLIPGEDGALKLVDSTGTPRAYISPDGSGGYVLQLNTAAGLPTVALNADGDKTLATSSGSVVLRVDDTDRLYLAVEDAAGLLQAGQVTVGAPDSAGVGYRTLRIPN